MDQETIENHIKNLGKRDFDSLVAVLLTSFYGLTAIDVDGPGDGGSDYRVFSDNDATRTFAIQKTVQERDWEDKAIGDARKCVSELQAGRYFFLTSRAHASSTLRSLESRISAELKIPATCLGATELAGIVVEQDLLREFADAIGLQIDIRTKQRPDRLEILLHAYASFGLERSELRNEIYDDTLLLALHDAGAPLSRTQLLDQARTLIDASPIAAGNLTGRLDSLLTRGIVHRVAPDGIALSAGAQMQIAVADGIYEKELRQLASAQSQLLHEKAGIDWSEPLCIETATVLSRWFIQRQLQAAEHGAVQISRQGWSRALGNPESDLRTLLDRAGVPADRMIEVLDGLVELARGIPLMSKLTRAVTYVATEGTNVLRASRALGVASWSDVIVTLDASVAIPFLCSAMFAPTSGRFSEGSTQCIELLREADAQIVIPWVYINEVSAHLIRALQYQEIQELTRAMEHSQNGFVAHYYQLRRAGFDVPPSLRDFVGQFSHAAIQNRTPNVRDVMAQIQPLLNGYGVRFDDLGRIPDHYRKAVEQSIDSQMHALNRTKPSRLVDDDVRVLAHARRCLTERSETRLCVTWDAVMIAVARELADCGLVISPQELADIVQPRVRTSGKKLMALAHGLARMRERPSEIGARIVDRVTQLAAEKLQDWQFRKRLRDFYNAALSRVDLTSDSYYDIDREIERFLRDEDVPSLASDVEEPE